MVAGAGCSALIASAGCSAIIIGGMSLLRFRRLAIGNDIINCTLGQFAQRNFNSDSDDRRCKLRIALIHIAGLRNFAISRTSRRIKLKNRQRVLIGRAGMEAAIARTYNTFMGICLADFKLKTTAGKIAVKALDRSHNIISHIDFLSSLLHPTYTH